jgi:hypothetical protein
MNQTLRLFNQRQLWFPMCVTACLCFLDEMLWVLLLMFELTIRAVLLHTVDTFKVNDLRYVLTFRANKSWWICCCLLFLYFFFNLSNGLWLLKGLLDRFLLWSGNSRTCSFLSQQCSLLINLKRRRRSFSWHMVINNPTELRHLLALKTINVISMSLCIE